MTNANHQKGPPGENGIPGRSFSEEEVRDICYNVLRSQLEELTANLQGPPGPPGVGKRGQAGPQGPQGKFTDCACGFSVSTFISSQVHPETKEEQGREDSRDFLVCQDLTASKDFKVNKAKKVTKENAAR